MEMPSFPIFTKQEERNKREQTCNSCERKNDKKCGVCGCYLMLLKKVKHSKCPLNKW
jgi:hypothetical protein